MAIDSVNEIICSGGLILSASTKRFLFLLRNNGKTAGSWGFVGGKKEPADKTNLDILSREIEEELGSVPAIKKVIPLELYLSDNLQFQYNTFVILVDNEFIPILNNEHSAYAWCNYNKWPRPLHKRIGASFNNKIIKAKLEILLEMI